MVIISVFCVAVRGRLEVINGDDADAYEYPFMVRLLIGRSHYCGASLIRPNIVLTAAHCVDDDYRYSVVVGDHVDGGTGLHERVVNISKIKIHEEYGSFRSAPINDLALLVLTDNVELKENIVETIGLAQKEDFYEEGTSVTVIGWGTTENYTLANVLQELEYEVANQNACHEHWEKDSGHNLNEILADQVCIIDPKLQSSAFY